ncbi:penicillin-binding protein 2 [Francisellaceae bacterium]|nr:penicillin-binding protein 2 [Francisellaceae bacterium]
MHLDFKPASKKKSDTAPKRNKITFGFAAGLILIIAATLLYRLLYIDTADHSFLTQQAQHQIVQTENLTATRGIIFDRHNIPLAVSTTLYKVILNIHIMSKFPKKYAELSHLNLPQLNKEHLNKLIQNQPNSRYHIALQYITPRQAKALKALHVPGVYLKKHLRTYYPEGNAMAQLVGFTNANDQGQAGIEAIENKELHARSGIETVETDSRGNIIKILKPAKHFHQGENIHLSIDAHIQEFAFDALKKGVIDADANSGAVAVINPQTGEVLAAASYPSFNPNQFSTRTGRNIAERPIIDTFEPGSTMKPFIVAMGLKSGKYTPNTLIDTSPGSYDLQGHVIKDDADFGTITVTQVLQKSSNIGISKIALSLDRNNVGDFLRKLGFGSQLGYAFPGEDSGFLPLLSSLGKFSYATTAFGYGMTTSVLQLAHAYTIFANNGKLCPLSLLKDKQPPTCPQALAPKYADAVRKMLHSVVTVHGTGVLATIPGFEVGGKTGTTHKVANGKFLPHSYNAIFAGLAPLHNPKLVIVVWIDNPKKNHFYQYGGVSAAPIFASIAKNSLEYLGTPYHESLKKYKLLNQNKAWLLHVIENN